MATIQVKDTGVGILGTHIGEIFNLFYRASYQDVGSGFGLYNVKSALAKLNGQIAVNSVLDQGTILYRYHPVGLNLWLTLLLLSMKTSSIAL